MNQPCVRSSLPSFVSPDEDDDRDLTKMEEKVWEPNSSLTEKQIDQFLVVARWVGADELFSLTSFPAWYIRNII